jgi:hypothetical protein
MFLNHSCDLYLGVKMVSKDVDPVSVHRAYACMNNLYGSEAN